jgi:hypothetical protein
MIRSRTVPATQLSTTWRRSSYSDGEGGNCVEVANLTTTPGQGVAVRDSKNPEGPALLVPAKAFIAFIAGVRAGRGA